MTLALVIAGAVLGAIIGSYIATFCLRWPRGIQASGGRSSCDGCGRVLSPFELVPVASAIVVGGKCRSCGVAIDLLHLHIEVAAAVIGALAMLVSPDERGVALALFAWLLLPLAILDWRHFWLPDRLTAALAAAGLAAGGFLSGASLIDRLIGGAAGFLALFLLATAYRRLRQREGLGGGDAKLMGAMGLWTGWAALPLIMVGASLLGLAIAIVRRHSGTDPIPLGTLLAAAAGGWALLIVLEPQLRGVG